MKTKNLNLIPLVLVLSGCVTSPTIQNKTDSIVNDKFGNYSIFPKDEDLEQCPEFPLFKGKTFGDLYEFTVSEVSKQYSICSSRAKLSQDYIKKIYKK